MSSLKNLLEIFEKKQKLKILTISIFSILLAFFELLGVSLFIPLIGILIENDLSNNFQFLNFLIPSIHESSAVKSINFALLIIFCIFLLKFLFINFINIFNNNIIFNIQRKLKENLFKNYLNRNYLSFISQNMSYATRTIIENVNQLTFGVLRSYLILLADLVLIIFLLSFLIYLNPKSALLVLIIFGSSSFLFMWVLNKRLKIWGEDRNYHSGESIKYLQESLKGFKEIKLSNLFEFFLDKFRYHNKLSTSASKKQVISSAVPQYFLELIAILSFTIFIITLNSQGLSGPEVIALLGVYGAASFKILPSINRIVIAWNTIKFGDACVTNVKKNILHDVTKKKFIENFEMNFENISFSNVNFEYNDTKKIFDDLSVELKKKEIIGIFGESGSGKSTFVNLLCGLFKPHQGEIKFNNKSIYNNLNSYQKKLGVVPQDVFILDDTIEKNIAIGINKESINKELVYEILDKVNLLEVVQNLPKKLDTQIGENGVFLSGGQKQRIGIARALYKKPDIIVFDESTNSLDEITENEFMKNVIKLKDEALIIFITHKKKLSTYFSQSYELKNKKLEKL